MAVLAGGDLPLDGLIETLPRGSLSVAGPYRLLASRTAGGLFTADGRQSELGRRPLAGGRALGQAAGPVVETHDAEVVWGGSLKDELLGHLLNHYGHFLVESVSRLWPVVPGGELSDLPVMFSAASERQFKDEWLSGLAAPTVELPADGAVCFQRVYIAEPALRLGAWIAPELRDIHLHVRDGLDVAPAPSCEVLWLSRSKLAPSRVAYDENLLEWILGDRVVSVCPEEFDLAAQVAMLEGARAVAGVVGSAFHTLLLTRETPRSLYLCPSRDQGAFAAQHILLGCEATFAWALSNVVHTPAARTGTQRLFPRGYRVMIPEALRALQATLLPDLFDDPRIELFATPQARPPRASAGGTVSLDASIGRVLLDPHSGSARVALAEAFAERGIENCASEQYAAAAHLEGWSR
jgi:hypothetical protein